MNLEIGLQSEWFQDHNKERGEKLGASTLWATPTLCMGKSECEGAERGCDEGKAGVRTGECARNHTKKDSFGKKSINNIKCILESKRMGLEFIAAFIHKMLNG